MAKKKESRAEKSLRLIEEVTAEFGPHIVLTAKGGIKCLTDVWWAQYFQKMQDTRLVRLLGEKRYHRFDQFSKVYVPVSEDIILTELMSLVYEASRTWTDDSGSMLTDEGLARVRNVKDLAGVIRILKGVTEVPGDFFQSREKLVHLENVTLRFNDDGELIGVEAADEKHRTKKRAPFKYDPQARCDMFREKVLSHLPEDMQILIQKYSGQCLLGWNLMQRFLCLVGEGGSSKGTLVEVIKGMIGTDHVRELRTEQLNQRFEIGLVRDASLLVGADVGGDFLASKGAKRVKSLTGKDGVLVELKFGTEARDIRGEFNILITSNEELRVNPEGDRRSWERRLLYIPYNKMFSGGVILGLSDKILASEGSGVINWALEGLSMVIQDYRETGDIRLTEAQRALHDEILSENDWFRLFIKERIQRGNADITRDEILEIFSHYCLAKKQTIPHPRELRRKLPQVMEILFGAKESHSLKRGMDEKEGYRGVEWKNGNP